MITSIISFVVAFGLLVLVHEFGHFWVARRTGVAVEKFSIGFGPKLFGFHHKGTFFQISLLPLGGFVKMKGEEANEVVDPNDKSAFSNKPVAARSAIVLAGPFMNLVLSFLLMPLVFWMGKPEPAFLAEPAVIERILPNSPAEKAGLRLGDKIASLNGKPASNWQEVLQNLAIVSPGGSVSIAVERGEKTETFRFQTETIPGGKEGYAGFEKFFGTAPKAVIQGVDPNGAAGRAGLKARDEVEKIEGTPVADWDDLVRRIQSHGSASLTIEVLREGKPLAFEVEPLWDAQAKKYMIGIQGGAAQAPLLFATRKYSLREAIAVGFKTNWENVLLTFQVLKKLVTLELSYKTLGGPVRIAYTLAQASASGLADFLYFTAFLSLQLAILNILPIPVLDGGHLVFYLIEGIRRKPLSVKTRLIAQQVGLALLLTLILFVTWNDVEKLFF